MSYTTYDNDNTGGITVIIEDVDKEDTDEQSPKVFPGKNPLGNADAVENEKDDNVPQTSRKRGSVTFTVTKVDEDEHEDSSQAPGQKSKSNKNGPVSQFHLLQVPEPSHSDGETSYSDTLTQNSITRLLSKKFKTYRTYRYDLRKREDSESEPVFKRRIISKYESQDYDQCENLLFLKEQEKLKSHKVQRKWLARWIVNLLIGVGTALVATFIEVCIEYTAEYKFKGIMALLDHCDQGGCIVLPLLLWIAINAFLVFLGSALVTFVEPQAVGSGIPQIKCYLNGVKIPGLLSFRALVAKSVGVVFSVAGGLACGKEGPMIHSGAIVAAGVSQGRSRVLNRDFKIFEYLRSDTERRDFVSGGAAAGVSAAFGAPVGGVLFSLEEGASFWNQFLTWRIVFASMVATFTVNLILSAVHGHPADLSNPGLISFGRFSHITYHTIEIPIFLLMAVIGGLSGALFNGLNAKLTVFRKRYILGKWSKVFEAVIVSIMSAVMGFLLIFCVDECTQDEKSDENHHHGSVQLNCPEGHHNIMSKIFFKTPEASLIGMLHDSEASYTVLTLALFASLYFLLAVWTYGLSVSSGVFIPSLLTGAAWGRLIGMGVMYLFPHMSNNVAKYALIGAACQLGGTVRMTISLTVILLECTGDITFGLPVIMVLIVAKWVGDLFNTGLYDLHIQMMGIPLLPWEPPEMSYDITASQVMNSPVAVLRAEETVERVMHVLDTINHSGFPVVDEYEIEESQQKQTEENQEKDNQAEQKEVKVEPQEKKYVKYGRLKGLILRSQLILLLKHKAFTRFKHQKSPEVIEGELELKHFRDFYTRDMKIVECEISDEEKSFWMDLKPFMNPTPYTVPMNASMPRMFRLFRGLGLRHLIIVDEQNKVVGMVTRKDLAKYRQTQTRTNVGVQQLQIRQD